MKKIDLFEVYRFGNCLRFFDKLTPQTRPGDIVQECATAFTWFDWLLTRDHIPVVDSGADVQFLKSWCEQIVNAVTNEELGAERHEIIKYHFDRFEHVFQAEMSRLNVYFVTKVNAYDTDTLLSNGRAALPEKITANMDDNSLKCFEEGTRCLGLKLATSAGFQFLRAVEGMMHEFYDVLSGGSPRPKRREMGGYIEALEKLKTVDPRMTDVLRGVKNLRRNPLMHPEDFLDMDDALIVFDITKSAISTMVILAQEHKKGTP